MTSKELCVQNCAGCWRTSGTARLRRTHLHSHPKHATGCRRHRSLLCVAAAPSQGALHQGHAPVSAEGTLGHHLEAAAATDPSELVELGTFGAPHGVKGELKLFPGTDSPADRLSCAGTRFVMPSRGGMRRRKDVLRSVHVEGGRRTLIKGREVWLLRLQGVHTPEAADALVGHTLLMRASERPALASADEFYVQELVGMQVILQETGRRIGTVVDLYDGTGTHDVLRVQLCEEDEPPSDGSSERVAGSARTVLVPFAADIVPVVDRAQRRMEVRPPEGLLELATRQAAKPAKSARK